MSKTIDGSEQGLLGKLNPLKGLGESFGKLKDSLLQPFKNFGTALATPFKKIGSMIQSPFKALGDGVKKIKGVFGKNEEVKIKDLQLEELKGINQKMSSLVDFLTDETSEATREESRNTTISVPTSAPIAAPAKTPRTKQIAGSTPFLTSKAKTYAATA